MRLKGKDRSMLRTDCQLKVVPAAVSEAIADSGGYDLAQVLLSACSVAKIISVHLC